MKKFKATFNNKGLTLIELLASMVILSIVIIFFLSFFSQSIMLSVKVEDQLTTVNVAERIMNNVRKLPEGDLDPGPCGNEYKHEPSYEVNGKHYYPAVAICQSHEEKHLDLYRIHVKIYTNNDYNASPSSEIYGYRKVGE
ncbi:prepilin-type N-terminal cleavage/methylation domain-containing protein [bacterium LRH843]|nr:prepilin-type N-terminal cleavage/methylation domain-containing protein [bacterium LRH843]